MATTTTTQIDLLATPSDLKEEGREKVATGLKTLLADVFALYLKTKNYHWHMSGRNFRDYHLMLDEQAQQLFAITDPIAERGRKLGFTTLHSIGEIAKIQRIQDSDDTYVNPVDMLTNLTDDNVQLTHYMRELHKDCDDANDVATASLLEVYIDEAERRTWFLYEATRPVE